jgi:DNA-binding IclR family transcriptional regulator
MPTDLTNIRYHKAVTSEGAGAGVQTLDRAINILRLLGAGGSVGLRLVDVERGSRLPRPTAHRILKALERQGFVAQRPDTRRYELGLELAILGASVTSLPRDLRHLCDHEMTSLAEQTGDTAYLTVRSGYETVCLDRKMGPFPLKALSVDIGMRRPLGSGASGIMLLASLGADQVEDAIAVVAKRFPDRPNVTEQSLRAAVRSARQKGYAYSDGTVSDDIRGLGVPIRDADGAIIAALSVAAIRTRVMPDRVPSLVQILRNLCSRIERHLASESPKFHASKLTEPALSRAGVRSRAARGRSGERGETGG